MVINKFSRCIVLFIFVLLIVNELFFFFLVSGGFSWTVFCGQQYIATLSMNGIWLSFMFRKKQIVFWHWLLGIKPSCRFEANSTTYGKLTALAHIVENRTISSDLEPNSTAQNKPSALVTFNSAVDWQPANLIFMQTKFEKFMNCHWEVGIVLFDKQAGSYSFTTNFITPEVNG